MRKSIQFSLVLALIACIAWNLCSFGADCEKVRRDVLRLHILANSDSSADQALKLKVRNRLLEEGYDIFEGAITLQQAKKKVTQNREKIVRICREEIKQSGFDYPVTATLEKCYFETRVYERVTLPAGEYEALRIVIGKGEGHNWWCVIFPSLCFSLCENSDALESLSESDRRLILSDPHFEIRFKCVEMIERLKNELNK